MGSLPILIHLRVPPMRKHLFAIVVLSLGLANGASAAEPIAPRPANADQWRAAALRDIQAGYEVTLANHAGTRDPHNPAFPGNLERARTQAQALAASVKDAVGYHAALLRFTALIGDGHAGVYPSFDVDEFRPTRWPGFVVAWRGDLFVLSAEDNAARAGERIVSCDGTPAQRLMEDKVFGYFGRPKEEGQWWGQARQLFYDNGNPFAPRPTRCVFEADGKQVERTLDWRDAPKDLYQRGREGVIGKPLPLGLSEPRKGLFWVAIPTFDPGENERAAYRALYKQIGDGRQRFLDADAVVVDLRGNNGGSSWWSRDFAAALWGEGRLTRRAAAATAKQETWYRAAPDNIAYFRQLAEERSAQGEAQTAQWSKAIADNMDQARAAGQDYFVNKSTSAPLAADPQADLPGDPAPFTRPLYVIVPGNCASACLDAIDYFKLFPNTKLVGAPSSADSTYMEVRLVALPGGLGRVVVPTKLYVNRPRGNGVFYRADIPVTALQWTFEAFRDAIEADLARKP